jgi:hypothetical protein
MKEQQLLLFAKRRMPKLRQLAKQLLPAVAVDAVRKKRSENALRQYLNSGIIPWSPGYSTYKWRLITEALANRGLLGRFRLGEQLPDGYGVGIDERCIEYLWLVAHLHNGPEVLLDAGSTLNYSFLLDHPAFQNKVIHILTLAPEGNCFWRKAISYVFHDLRVIPMRDAYYDTINCISTLEHVGCDNSGVTRNQANKEHNPEDFVLVMREFYRILKSGGILFLTVPFGVYRHFGSFQQFDRELLYRAIEAFGEARDVKVTFYRYTGGGWNLADAETCADCDYVSWVAAAWLRHEWPNPLPVEWDKAAAARAVACVQLTKK